MSKPYPCCCGCVNCDEYTLDDWRARFCGLTDGASTFTSSSTGNSLATDLNALADVIYQPTLLTITNPKDFFKDSIVVLSGESWLYGSTAISNVVFEVFGVDDCGKRRLYSVAIRCTLNAFSGRIIWATQKAALPSTPNCGAVLVADESLFVSGSSLGLVLGIAGSLKTQFDNGTSLTC